jgi:hypothetical protein
MGSVELTTQFAEQAAGRMRPLIAESNRKVSISAHTYLLSNTAKKNAQQ